MPKMLTGFRRLRRDESGATAVEFGIIAAPFLALLMAIVETILMFWASQTLESAVADTSRLILTGQAQSQNFDKAKFKAALCGRIVGMFDCANGMQVEVRCFNSFSIGAPTSPLDANGNLKTNFGYCNSSPGQTVVVRAMYAWPVWISLLGFNLSDMGGGKRLLVATAAFRNEPFPE